MYDKISTVSTTTLCFQKQIVERQLQNNQECLPSMEQQLCMLFQTNTNCLPLLDLNNKNTVCKSPFDSFQSKKCNKEAAGAKNLDRNLIPSCSMSLSPSVCVLDFNFLYYIKCKVYYLIIRKFQEHDVKYE